MWLALGNCRLLTQHPNQIPAHRIRRRALAHLCDPSSFVASSSSANSPMSHMILCQRTRGPSARGNDLACSVSTSRQSRASQYLAAVRMNLAQLSDARLTNAKAAVVAESNQLLDRCLAAIRTSSKATCGAGICRWCVGLHCDTFVSVSCRIPSTPRGRQSSRLASTANPRCCGDRRCVRAHEPQPYQISRLHAHRVHARENPTGMRHRSHAARATLRKNSPSAV